MQKRDFRSMNVPCKSDTLRQWSRLKQAAHDIPGIPLELHGTPELRGTPVELPDEESLIFEEKGKKEKKLLLLRS